MVEKQCEKLIKVIWESVERHNDIGLPAKGGSLNAEAVVYHVTWRKMLGQGNVICTPLGVKILH
jgi:hypothetical protein